MRLPLRPLPLCLPATVLLAGCAATERLPDAHHVLAERQQLVLATRPHLRLTYEGARDSRCPADVRCVWPGQIAYRFTLRIDNVAQGFWLVPGKPGYASPALLGARIELDRRQGPPPPPPSGTVQPVPVAINIYGH